MFYAQHSNRRKHWYRMLSIGQRKLLIPAVCLGVLVLMALSVLIFYTSRAMSYDIGDVVSNRGDSMLFDADNRPVASLSDPNYRPLQWSELPQPLIDAFVAREDESFFSHNGVVLSAVMRSLLRNIASMRYEQGASTITMQLTRNVFELTMDKSLDRKMLEIVLAQRIERNYDKQTILLQYLSRIFFGQGCYGVRAAAQRYFGKPVHQLNLEECATLAGLVRGPSIFNPEVSIAAATAVRNETLQRMWDCDMISDAEYMRAKASPMKLNRREEGEVSAPTYPSMWARGELSELYEQVGRDSGVSVVSNLLLPLQQFVEEEVENVLTAVESPASYPESWKTMAESPEAADEQQKAFAKLKRPKELKVRGRDNDLTDLLQCCVLVVDGRKGRRGNVLAVAGGRSVMDARDRWQDAIQPGRVSAPLVFCCACLPGADNLHIVARSAEITGRSMSYDVVRAFYDSLKLQGITLPEREAEEDLYNGRFLMKRLDLARLLFCLQNQGRGYRLSLINTIWTTGATPTALYRYEPEKAPEYIRRESATTVAQLPPFVAAEGTPVALNETLPSGYGQFAMLCRTKGICVFVWMGFDSPSHPVAQTKEMRALLPKASMNLARTVYERARQEVRKGDNR